MATRYDKAGSLKVGEWVRDPVAGSFAKVLTLTRIDDMIYTTERSEDPAIGAYSSDYKVTEMISIRS